MIGALIWKGAGNMSRKKKQQAKACKLNEYAAGKVTELLGECFEKICKEIDDEFYTREEELCTFFSVIIGTTFFGDDEPLPHYRWSYDGCSYDYSGELIRDGDINIDITLGEFLDEYTGSKWATFESGRGWSYTRYEKEVSHDLLEIGEMIMRSVIERYVDTERLTGDSELLFWDEIHDSFYDNTLTYSFFCTELIASSGLSVFDYDMPLQDYLQIGKPYWKVFLSKLERYKEETASPGLVDTATKYNIFHNMPKIMLFD